MMLRILKCSTNRHLRSVLEQMSNLNLTKLIRISRKIKRTMVSKISRQSEMVKAKKDNPLNLVTEAGEVEDTEENHPTAATTIGKKEMKAKAGDKQSTSKTITEAEAEAIADVEAMTTSTDIRTTGDRIRSSEIDSRKKMMKDSKQYRRNLTDKHTEGVATTSIMSIEVEEGELRISEAIEVAEDEDMISERILPSPTKRTHKRAFRRVTSHSQNKRVQAKMTTNTKR